MIINKMKVFLQLPPRPVLRKRVGVRVISSVRRLWSLENTLTLAPSRRTGRGDKEFNLPLTISAILALPLLASAGPATSPAIDLSATTGPVISAADAVDVVREGTHFISRICSLTHTTDGQSAMLTFDNSGAATNSPPMIVLPNQNLYSMENVTVSKGSPVQFRISGTVTEYKNRNYILIDGVQTTLANGVAPVTPKSATEKAGSTKPFFPNNELPSTSSPTAVTHRDSATSKMNRLLAPLPNSGAQLPVASYENAPTITVNSGSSAVAPSAPVLKLLREGKHLNDRIGRLNHSSDGQQAFFTFDSDGKTLQDAPLIILPSLKLSEMEGVVSGRASDVHFRISGTATEYRGRNYILLDKAVAIADAEVPF